MVNADIIESSYFDVKICHMAESSTYLNRMFNNFANEKNV